MIFETSRQARFMIPMAISLGYGILFATGITLVLVPSLYRIVEDLRAVLARATSGGSGLSARIASKTRSPSCHWAAGSVRVGSSRIRWESVMRYASSLLGVLLLACVVPACGGSPTPPAQPGGSPASGRGGLRSRHAARTCSCSGWTIDLRRPITSG